MITHALTKLLLRLNYARTLPVYMAYQTSLQKEKIKKDLDRWRDVTSGMWFFHAVFFSTYICDTFQPILRMVKPPVLMYLWCVALSLAGAYAYQGLLNGLKQLKNKVVDK